MNIHELQGASSGVLLEHLIQAATEKGILLASDPPIEEMKNVQQRIDLMQEQVLRRMSW